MRYFDSLVHTTNDGSWLGSTRYDASYDRLMRELDAVPNSRACLVAIAGHVDNQWVMEHSGRSQGRLVPVGSINPAEYSTSTGAEAAVQELFEQGFRGLKLHPRLGDYDPLDERNLAAIEAACDVGLVVFLDTLFRQPRRLTRHASDVIDQVAQISTSGRVVLLHGGGPAMLEVFDLVRMHTHLVLDLSFSLMRYAGSSLDADMQFIFQQLDQRVTIGSDMPEYTPTQALARFEALTVGLGDEKRQNILWRNLEMLFPSPANVS